MRVAFDEARKRVLSTGVFNQLVKAAESLTKERYNNAPNTKQQVTVKVESEPVYNDVDDRFGLGALFPPPLFAPSSPITSEDEGTYLDIDLSKTNDIEPDSLQSTSSSHLKATAERVEIEPTKPSLTSEDVLLLYARIDKSKKTKNRQNSTNDENNDKLGQPGLISDSIITDSPIISRDRSLPRKRDYHPRKVNDQDWSMKVVEVSINDPHEHVRPLPPLPKDTLVVAEEGRVNIYATHPSD